MSQPPASSPEILAALAARGDPSGFIELPDFVETALYHPQFGYYRQAQSRVGRHPQSDFFTSVSLREAFAEIALEASYALLSSIGLQPSETVWVEIGAEPRSSLLSGKQTRFKSTRAIGIGDAIAIPPQSLVFSNELFDAQPFRQIRYDGDKWVEYGVAIDARSSKVSWAPRSCLSSEAEAYLHRIPTHIASEYTIDLPVGASRLARSILGAPWRGAFIAFDYGKTWQALSTEAPQGTARAYYRHQQRPGILESPGQIDITHHICWDDLETELATTQFDKVSLQSQESFIVHRAPKFLEKAFDPSLPTFSPIRQKLKELMHPALMGQKFQALTATRPSPTPDT